MTIDEIQAQLADDVTLDEAAQERLLAAIEALDEPMRASLSEAFLVRYPEDGDFKGFLDE